MPISSIKVLIAGECSGVVRRAFAAQGMDAWSCDLQPTRDCGAKHLQCDVREILNLGWTLMIAHPPCTYLSYAGARWWKREGIAERQKEALSLFATLLDAPIPHIAIENPRGLPLQVFGAAQDVIEPYEFGDPYKKRTYLWLKELPPLIRTFMCTDYQVNWTCSVTINRSYERSKTFPGIAAAMAHQWKGFLSEK